MLLSWLQIQANLGEGHVNIINAFEAVLTETHLALVMEYAACGSLTSYVANRWQVAQHTGLFLSEDEARYFMRVSFNSMKAYSLRALTLCSPAHACTLHKHYTVLGHCLTDVLCHAAIHPSCRLLP